MTVSSLVLSDADLDCLERLKLRLPINKRFINVGTGWLGLLSDLQRRLEGFDAIIEIEEITERDGLLHIELLNVSGFDELNVYQAINEVELSSAFICEVTGRPGLLVHTGDRHRVLSPMFFKKDTKIIPVSSVLLSYLSGETLVNLIKDAIDIKQ